VIAESETHLLEMEDAEGGLVAIKNHAGILHAARAMYQEGKASWRRFVNHFAEEHRRAAQKEFKAEMNNYLYLAIAAERLGADHEAGNRALRMFLSPEIMRRVPITKFRSAMTFINSVLTEAEAAGIQSRICTSKAVLFSRVGNDEAAEKEALGLCEQEEDESKALALHAWAWINGEDSQTALSYVELALKFQKHENFACDGIAYAWKNFSKALAERWSAVDLEDYADLGRCNPLRAPALRFQRRMKRISLRGGSHTKICHYVENASSTATIIFKDSSTTGKSANTGSCTLPLPPGMGWNMNPFCNTSPSACFICHSQHPLSLSPCRVHHQGKA